MIWENECFLPKKSLKAKTFLGIWGFLGAQENISTPGKFSKPPGFVFEKKTPDF